MMDSSGFNSALMAIVGPLLIVIVLAWVMIKNKKKSSRADIERTERATRELYKEEDAAHRREDNNVP